MRIFLILIASAALGAESAPVDSGFDLRSLGDHLGARRNYLSSLLAATDPKAILAFKDALYASGGESTHVYVQKGGEAISVVFSANPRGGAKMPGDYIIKKSSAKTSYLVEISVVLKEGGSDYLLLRALDSQRTALDLVSGERKVKEKVVLGIPLYYLLVKGFGDILDLAGARVPWAEIGARAD